MTVHRQLVVGVVGTARPWRAQLAAYVREHVDTVSIRVAYEQRELLESSFDAVIVDDVTSWITKPVVDRLVSAGTAVIGVFDPEEGEGQGERYIARLGVPHTVPATATPAELAAVFLDLLDRPSSISPARAGAYAEGGRALLRGVVGGELVCRDGTDLTVEATAYIASRSVLT